MNLTQLRAQVKAAAFQIVAIFGYNQAVKILEEVLTEIKDEQWK